MSVLFMNSRGGDAHCFFRMDRLVAAQEQWMLEEEIAADTPMHRVRDDADKP
jgi:hypothetical protein